MARPRSGFYAFAMLVLLAGPIAGCAGPSHLVAPVPSPNSERLGTVEKEACGSLLFGVIPVRLNGRVERAYTLALKEQPGATGLMDVELKERWFWWLVGETRCTALSGVAYR